jgi:hypothetical protein
VDALAEGVDEHHRFDVQRLMRQAPAIAEAIFVDGKGVERLRVSRTGGDVEMSGVEHFATVPDFPIAAAK